MEINSECGKVFRHSLFRVLPAVLFFILFNGSRADAQEQLDVIKGRWLAYNNASGSLYGHLTKQALTLLDQRVRGNRTVGEWTERQKFIRKALNEITGPFPAKTALNARIIRTIVKPGYRIEHIIFESQPGFIVTSSLFLPEGTKKKKPAIIYCSGHSEDGYRSAVYQHVILNLVKKGFIVFAFDPVGQGERLEYLNIETGKSAVGGPTKEHSWPGAQAFISGSSQAFYMIWDGIRAVDYLLSRKEVDASRIGITGRSGGGTQSAYIAAFDERIYAAAPENYITNYSRLLQSIGPQDAEQNLPGIIARGLDHPDFLIVRAPKPALMITTSGDMFSIQGAMETAKETEQIYKAFGKKENFSRVEDDAGHASTLKNREAMYAFFQKHLNNPGNKADEEIPLLTADELRVTPTGQVSTSTGSETVFSLNRKAAELKEKRLDSLRSNPEEFLPSAIRSAIRLSGYQDPLTVSEPVFTGRIIRDGYTIEKYFVQGEGDYVIPYLLFNPAEHANKYLIYLNPAGKSAEAMPGGEIEKFVRKGITVLAPDLPGTGELASAGFKGDADFEGISHNIWYASILIGRSITGIQAGDIARLSMILKRIDSGADITGFARNEMGAVLLHAAVAGRTISSLILAGPYTSYYSIVKERFYRNNFVLSAVPGALKEYDLPDLAAGFAPRKLVIARLTDGTGNPGTVEAARDIEIIKAGYRSGNAADSLIILTEDSVDRLYTLF